MNNIEKIEKYRLVTEFIFCNYGVFCKKNGTILKLEHLNDVAALNEIIGRMIVYKAIEPNQENFNLMCDYFNSELERRFYSLEEFEDFAKTRLLEQ